MADEDGYIRETTGYVSLEWTIKRFTSLSKTVLKSPKFVLSDATWHLELNPNRIRNGPWSDSVSLFIKKDKSESKAHYLEFSLGIQSSDGNVLLTRTDSCQFHEFGHRSYGWRMLIQRSILLENHNFLSNDTVIISCTARCPHLLDTYRKEAGSQTFRDDDVEILTKNLTDLFLEEKNSDVIFKVGERNFRAHKSILVARSPVFEAMFKYNMTENQTGVVNISDHDPEAFEDFLYYLYNAKIRIISKKKVVCLYSLADKYDVKSLSRQCVEFMLHNFSVECFCNFLVLAERYNELRLIDACEKFFSENAVKIMLTKEWQTFMIENKDVANELFIKYAKRFNGDS